MIREADAANRNIESSQKSTDEEKGFMSYFNDKISKLKEKTEKEHKK